MTLVAQGVLSCFSLPGLQCWAVWGWRAPGGGSGRAAGSPAKILLKRNQRAEMIIGSRKHLLCHLLVLSLLLAGCGPATTEPGGQTSAGSDVQVSPLVHASVLPTPTPVSAEAASPLQPTDIPPPTATAEKPAPAQAQSSTDQLVILHTNDNWGETEPCG